MVLQRLRTMQQKVNSKINFNSMRKPSDAEQPKLIYCTCATIADTTGTTTVTLFDEAMNSLVQTRCDELIIQQGYTDPYVIPDKIEAFKGVTKTFHLQFNNWLQSGSSQFVVNNVSVHTNIPKKQENVMTALSASEEAATISLITPAEEQKNALTIHHQSLTIHSNKRCPLQFQKQLPFPPSLHQIRMSTKGNFSTHQIARR